MLHSNSTPVKDRTLGKCLKEVFGDMPCRMLGTRGRCHMGLDWRLAQQPPPQLTPPSSLRPPTPPARRQTRAMTAAPAAIQPSQRQAQPLASQLQIQASQPDSGSTSQLEQPSLSQPTRRRRRAELHTPTLLPTQVTVAAPQPDMDLGKELAARKFSIPTLRQ